MESFPLDAPCGDYWGVVVNVALEVKLCASCQERFQIVVEVCMLMYSACAILLDMKCFNLCLIANSLSGDLTASR
jgi:hypothetical protein